MADANSLYKAGAPAYYSGETVAGFTPDQIAAQNGTVALAQAGSPLVNSAQTAVGNIINTTPGAGNPALQAYIANLTQTANANANSAANGGGRFGSGANATAAGTAVTNAALPVQVAQYNADRNAQLQAATEAPTLANYDFANLARIGTVGDQQQQQQQTLDNDQKARYDYSATAPETWLNQYLNQLNGSDANSWLTQTGTSTNTQKTSGGSALGTIAGLGLSAAGGLGGLGGLFSGFSSGVGTGLSQAAGLGGFTGGNIISGGAIPGINWNQAITGGGATYGPYL